MDRRQITDTLLMIEPTTFGFNQETAVNNFFMQKDGMLNRQESQELTESEFRKMVDQLRENGIQVIVVKDSNEPIKPDAIFPNNWISSHFGHRLAIYPMYAENRRTERRQEVISAINENGYGFTEVVDYSIYENEQKYLEGTGSMILDRVNRVAYASISERTNESLFRWFCDDFGFEPVIFHAVQTAGNKRLPVYHTNVVMSIGEDFAVLCTDCIDDEAERKQIVDKLEQSGRTMIKISEEQMHAFAGNILQVLNQKGEKFIVLSASAYNSLAHPQIDALKATSQLIVVSIPTIERLGGGSVRCMMAEIFGDKVK